MPARFVNVDRNTPILLPTDMREWLPENHMAHFIIDAVETIRPQGFKVNYRSSGSEQYPPWMMLCLMVYCYATGRMSSREIEAATYYDVAVRYISADTHPDHDTICTFRTENRELFADAFVKVLALAQELGHLKKVGGISIDGTKIKANASKHSAVSYSHAQMLIERLENEVEQLMRKAEEADSTPLDDGLSVPEEIARRTERIDKLKDACELIEERFEERRKEKQAEYEAKIDQRKRREEQGKPMRGRPPAPPSEQPEDKAQVNFTDSDSRIMKAGNGQHFEQAYNAQAAVDIEGSMLVLGQHVTAEGNDKQQLVAGVNDVAPEIREVTEVLADAGYYNEAAIASIEADDGPVVYASPNKIGHRVTVEDLEKRPDAEPPTNASASDTMRHKLQTKHGKARYALRKQTVEPVFGIIKEVLGFRQFHLRGHPKVQTEWTLVTLAYNMKRLYNMAGCTAMPEMTQI